MSKEAIASCTIVGSFSRFKPQIDATRDMFEASNISVLAPPRGRVASIEKGFKILDTDIAAGISPIQSEATFVSAMAQSDFIYVVAGGGYVGFSGSQEILVAMYIFKKPIFSSETLDPNLDGGHPLWKATATAVRPRSIPDVITLAQKPKIMRNKLLEAVYKFTHRRNTVSDSLFWAQWIIGGEELKEEGLII